MNNIKEYILIERDSAKTLTNVVNELLDEGWALYGSPTSSSYGPSKYKLFTQALVKYKEEEVVDIVSN